VREWSTESNTGPDDVIRPLYLIRLQILCALSLMCTTLRPIQLNKWSRERTIRFNPRKSSFKNRGTCNASLLGKTWTCDI